MPLSPEMLQLLMEGDNAPDWRPSTGPFAPRMDPRHQALSDEPQFVPEPALSYPEPSQGGGFWSRLRDQYAENPTNYNTAGSDSPLLVALASAMNSGSQGLATRRMREREANTEKRTSLARLNMQTAKDRETQRGREYDRGTRMTLARIAAGGKAAPEVKPPDYSKPQPGETQAAFRARQLKEMKENADATRAPKEAKETPAAEKPGEAYSVETARRTLSAIDGVLPKLNWNTTGAVGSVASMVPGSPAKDVKAQLATIAGNIAFNALQQMRNASKTGGALGAVSDREILLLSSVEGSIQQDQSEKNLREQLGKVRASMERWLAVADGAAPAAAPAAARVRVKGPNGESGTVPSTSALPPGWTVVN